MSNRQLLLLPCLLLVSALFLAACGGSSGGGEEGKIEEAIEMEATGTDPANCKKFATQQFLEQSAGAEGAEAVKECEREATTQENTAESVEVAEIEENDSEATAEVTFTGSSLDGQSVEVALVKEGDSWKLNELVGFTKLDEPALVTAVGEQFKKQGDEGVELATCGEEIFEEAEQPEIEELLFGGTAKPLEEAIGGCQ